MTKLEIINETVLTYWKKGSRSVNPEFNQCRYIASDGKQCAFARCIENPEDMNEGEAISRSMFEEARFKEQYKGHGVDFWIDVQRLHDELENWNHGFDDENGYDGLSEQGKLFVAFLCEKYAGTNDPV